jgi:hypothetical protein
VAKAAVATVVAVTVAAAVVAAAVVAVVAAVVVAAKAAATGRAFNLIPPVDPRRRPVQQCARDTHVAVFRGICQSLKGFNGS